jgi:hypothetical protein
MAMTGEHATLMPCGEIPGKERNLAERLERGEVIYYPVCPFPLAAGDDERFLCEQRLASRAHKNISYDPHTGKASGYQWRSAAQALRLRQLLAAFSAEATAWLSEVLPGYARGWQHDRVSFRPEEEATRRLRLTARNDLLHVDAFPNRPTNGKRLLRVFVNLNPVDPRVWMTSEPFPVLFARYAKQAGLPGEYRPGPLAHLKESMARLFRPNRPRRSAYDAFMLRFHDFLKRNDSFQEKCPKRFWSFPSGSAWLCFTDTVSHAVLRGRYALEHSYFVALEDMVLPSHAPATIMAQSWPARARRGLAA